jgi:hypothetical protein
VVIVALGAPRSRLFVHVARRPRPVAAESAAYDFVMPGRCEATFAEKR